MNIYIYIYIYIYYINIYNFCNAFSNFFQRKISNVIDSLPRFDVALFDVIGLVLPFHLRHIIYIYIYIYYILTLLIVNYEII